MPSRGQVSWSRTNVCVYACAVQFYRFFLVKIKKPLRWWWLIMDEMPFQWLIIVESTNHQSSYALSSQSLRRCHSVFKQKTTTTIQIIYLYVTMQPHLQFTMIDDLIRFRKSAVLRKKTTGFTKEKWFRRRISESSSPVRRVVSFAQTVTIVCSNPPMSEKEINDAYYNDTELRHIKLAIVRIVRKMMAGTYEHDLDSLESETRGLEVLTPKGSKSRKMSKRVSMLTVLDEQDRQRLQWFRTVDSDHIAKMYSDISGHCQKKAVRIAANDAKLVQGHPETALCAPEVSQAMVVSPSAE